MYCDLWPYVLWPLAFQIQKRIISSETIWGNPVYVKFRAIVHFSNLGVQIVILSISLSVLFSETLNSGGAKVPPVPPLTTALNKFWNFEKIEKLKLRLTFQLFLFFQSFHDSESYSYNRADALRFYQDFSYPSVNFVITLIHRPFLPRFPLSIIVIWSVL